MKWAPLPIKRKIKHKVPHGFHEGVSKAISNALSYGIDSKKTLFQVHGCIPKLPREVVVQRWTTGITSSSLLVGVIYCVYYSVYNQMISSPFAGTVSAFVTSLIKLPIYNSIKLMQSGKASSVLDASKQLILNKKLYNGYSVSFCEDIVELDLRNRLYNTFKKDNFYYNISLGTVSSAIASAITTPFDNVRLQCVVGEQSKIKILKTLIQKRTLFSGILFRIQSNVTKNCSYFFFFEILKKII